MCVSVLDYRQSNNRYFVCASVQWNSEILETFLKEFNMQHNILRSSDTSLIFTLIPNSKETEVCHKVLSFMCILPTECLQCVKLHLGIQCTYIYKKNKKGYRSDNIIIPKSFLDCHS